MPILGTNLNITDVIFQRLLKIKPDSMKIRFAIIRVKIDVR